jgi:predicted transcriptional regulator
VVNAIPSVNFTSYDDMHRVLAPLRLAIIKALAGQGVLSIREVARRVERDVQAVHRDVTTLINAGIVDRMESGVEFPYERIHFEYDVSVAA